jgi:hypothetical protein
LRLFSGVRLIGSASRIFAVDANGFGYTRRSAQTVPKLYPIRRFQRQERHGKSVSCVLSADRKGSNPSFDDVHTLGCTYATVAITRLLIMHLPAGEDAPALERQAIIRKVVAAISDPLKHGPIKKHN